jgi:hypothetical protein
MGESNAKKFIDEQRKRKNDEEIHRWTKNEEIHRWTKNEEIHKWRKKKTETVKKFRNEQRKRQKRWRNSQRKKEKDRNGQEIQNEERKSRNGQEIQKWTKTKTVKFTYWNGEEIHKWTKQKKKTVKGDKIASVPWMSASAAVSVTWGSLPRERAAATATAMCALTAQSAWNGGSEDEPQKRQMQTHCNGESKDEPQNRQMQTQTRSVMERAKTSHRIDRCRHWHAVQWREQRRATE